MALTIQADPIPIREYESGALRVGGSRVLLELVIRSLEDGTTPEMIVQQFDTLTLPDVYAVIAYYLRHRDEIEAYLERREAEAGEVKRRIEARQGDLAGIRNRLLGRRGSLAHADAPTGE